MKFYLPGVDAELDAKEMVETILIALAVILAPMLVKFLLLKGGF